MRVKLLFFVISSLCFINVLAQGEFTEKLDTLNNNPTTNNNLTTNISFVDIKQEHSANKAAWMSAILPGMGQVYNQQWWKVPIIYAAAVGVTYFAITNNNNKNKFKDEYYNRMNGNTQSLLPDYASYTDAGIYNLYNAYKSNFQLSLIVGCFFYFANILDAYVYGHLFSFEIDDKLTMNIQPYTNHFLQSNYNSCGLALSIKF